MKLLNYSLFSWCLTGLCQVAFGADLYYPATETLDMKPRYFSASYTDPAHPQHQTMEVSATAVKVQIFNGPGSSMTTYVLDLSQGELTTATVTPLEPALTTTIPAEDCQRRAAYVEGLTTVATVAHDFSVGDGEYNEAIEAAAPWSLYLDSIVKAAKASCPAQ